MHQLVVRAELLSFMPFGDGCGVITFPIVGHAKRELPVKMFRLFSQNGFQLRDGGVIIPRAEVEHGIIV